MKPIRRVQAAPAPEPDEAARLDARLADFVEQRVDAFLLAAIHQHVSVVVDQELSAHLESVTSAAPAGPGAGNSIAQAQHSLVSHLEMQSLDAMVREIVRRRVDELLGYATGSGTGPTHQDVLDSVGADGVGNPRVMPPELRPQVKFGAKTESKPPPEP
jgi:hypothetical protein